MEISQGNNGWTLSRGRTFICPCRFRDIPGNLLMLGVCTGLKIEFSQRAAKIAILRLKEL
jgi:hypothetical protein